MAVLRTAVSIRALYLDEGGAPLVAERCVDVTCQMDLPEDCRLLAVGTNVLATSAMLKAGAPQGATGENAVLYQAARARIAGMVGSYQMDSYDAERDRGILTFRMDYKHAGFDFYFEANKFLEESDGYALSAGMGYKF